MAYRDLEKKRAYQREYDATHPERKRQKRAWENEHDRPICSRCGEPQGVGAHRYGRMTCQDCRHEINAAAVRARRERIAEMWRQGRKIREIADALGSTKNSIGVEMVRMRDEGWDLPFRHVRQKQRAA